MRRTLGILFFIALAVPVPAGTQGVPAPGDGVSRVLRDLERILLANDEAGYKTLLWTGGAVSTSSELLDEWIEPGSTRAVVQERLRIEAADLPAGTAYDLYADVLVETGRTGRVGTWLIRLRRDTSRPDSWSVGRLTVLTTVRGLYKISLDTSKQFTINNFALQAEDFVLRVPQGSAFVANTDAGLTALVVLGRGEMTFSPAPESEKGQVKIYGGSEKLTARFDMIFLRANATDFDNHLSASALQERALVDPRDLRRADQFFHENISRSFGIDLADLSREKWSVMPKYGDLVAEMDADRSHLTYMRSSSDPEDIRFFDRTRQRTISIYPSKQKLATRSRFFNEDDEAEYDIVNHEIEASFDPRREWIDGKATLLVTSRKGPLSTLILTLAEPLVIRSVVSRKLGYLMALRVSGQNDILINLPQPLMPNTLLDLQFTYGGRLPAVPPEREALQTQGSEFFSMPLQPSYIYTGRSGWYPQGQVTDYSTANLSLRVPEGYASVASGALDDGYPKLVTDEVNGGVWKEYRYSTTQPARYLGWAISKFVHVDDASVAISIQEGDSSPVLTGASYNVADVSVESSGLLQRKARDLSQETQRIIQFFGSLLGDIPYQSFTLAVVERSTPGGHSPPYFAVLSQPPPATPIAWRADPAYFDNFPEFFLAHETAHQWWGQAVGWKNYHEQWISEGIAQYFAALYAEHLNRKDLFADVLSQMTRSTTSRSDQGPVYLGYRLGHIKNDSRIFRALVYNKGALSLHMLRRLIGDEAFFRGLRRFYGQWRFRKAGTEDLRAAFEAEAERPLARFFDRWIYGSTLPRMKFTYTTEADAVTVRFEQIGEIFDVPITVTIEYPTSTLNVTVAVTEQVSSMRIPITGPLREVKANADNAAPVTFVR